MTKKNYKAVQLREYEKAETKIREGTNCFKCDGYDMYCSKYVPVVKEYTSSCKIKFDTQPIGKLEELLR